MFKKVKVKYTLSSLQLSWRNMGYINSGPELASWSRKWYSITKYVPISSIPFNII